MIDMKLTEVQKKKPWHHTEVDTVIALRAHAYQTEKGYYIKHSAEIMERAANELEYLRCQKGQRRDGLIDYSESDFQSWNEERERLLSENKRLKKALAVFTE